ncbi:MAG: FAD-dependent oxidoreductase [Acidobacteriota bacterium]
MRRQPSLLSSSRFDVLVVGGGIHGLTIAYDSARRGLSVALIDRNDLGAASSFNHAKTVHGGLRSLQTGDLGKARFSVIERRAMARIAPHLVTPLPFMVATMRTPTRSRLALRAGFTLDALVGFDRNAGIPDGLRLPAGRLVSLSEYGRAYGPHAQPRATGGARWYDYQMPESDRLTLAFARAADQAGALLANYVEATTPLVAGGRVRGVAALDLESGKHLEIAARLTVNAAGAFARPWARALGGTLDYPLIKAMNVVTSRPAGHLALGAPTGDGRLLLLIPWKGRAMLGTSHSDAPVEPGASEVSADELVRFLDEANQAFPGLGLASVDVTLVHRGIVPAVRDRRGRLGLMAHHRIHDHGRDGVEGAVSVIGVKYTTARGVAERVVDLVQAKLGRAVSACRTAADRLPAWEFESLPAEIARAHSATTGLLQPELAAALVGTHGTAWRDVVDLCRRDPALAAPLGTSTVMRAVVVHAVRFEMARTLADVVVRRTGLGSAGYPGDDVTAECARLSAAELGWDEARIRREIDAVREFYAPVRQPSQHTDHTGHPG